MDRYDDTASVDINVTMYCGPHRFDSTKYLVGSFIFNSSESNSDTFLLSTQMHGFFLSFVVLPPWMHYPNSLFGGDSNADFGSWACGVL